MENFFHKNQETSLKPTGITYGVCASTELHQLWLESISQWQTTLVITFMQPHNMCAYCKRRLQKAVNIIQGVHTSIVMCAHRMEKIIHGLHALDVTCALLENDVS